MTGGTAFITKLGLRAERAAGKSRAEVGGGGCLIFIRDPYDKDLTQGTILLLTVFETFSGSLLTYTVYVDVKIMRFEQALRIVRWQTNKNKSNDENTKM